MITLQLIGAEALVRLMTAEQDRRPDLCWLLFGPTDPAYVSADEPGEPGPILLAAE